MRTIAPVGSSKNAPVNLKAELQALDKMITRLMLGSQR